MTQNIDQTNLSLPTPAKEERNIGIELFRIVSMLMVVLLHVLGHGGVYNNTAVLSDNYKAAWFLETIAYCSVNCYALISGFANIRSSFKFRRIVYLWLEVVTLNTALTVFMHFFVPTATVTKEYVLRALFPLTRRAFWYFCAYFFMFPLIPILNNGILSLKKYQHAIISVMLMAPTVFRLIMRKDNYVLGSGYSALWLICLYVIGAYFRLYGAPKWAKWFVTLPAFFASAFVAWYHKIYAVTQFEEKLVTKESVLYANRDILISYISPCMVIMAVSLLLFFMQIKIKNRISKVMISHLGRATFGVFILHVGSAFWYWTDFWDRLKTFGKAPTVIEMVYKVLAATVLIYVAASLISLLRIYIFKLLRIHKAVDFFADLPEKISKKRQLKKKKTSDSSRTQNEK